MIQKAWDKLGEYLAVYLGIQIASLVLVWIIRKVKRGRDS